MPCGGQHDRTNGQREGEGQRLYRLTLTRVDVAVGVDSALLAMRNYCERAAKELHAAGGRILARDGRAPPSLQQQLEGLQAWHAFLTTRLQVFKVSSACLPSTR